MSAKTHWTQDGYVVCNYSGQARSTSRWKKSSDLRDVTCSRCLPQWLKDERKAAKKEVSS